MQNQNDSSKPAFQSRTLLLGIFILSGFAGLIYQSIWSQYLGIFLGHAAYAQALVLAIFMGGMAAGAMWISHAGERWRNLVRCYALTEGVIGLLGLAFHFIFTSVANFSYDVLIPAAGTAWLADVVRWLVAAALIIPQTVLLGMTFPLMSGGLIRRFPGQDGSLLGGLYFTNSIGAAAGALTASFVLLPALGLPGTVAVAGALNLVVAALAWWLARKPEPAAPAQAAQFKAQRPEQEPAPSLTTAGSATPDAAIPATGSTLLRVTLWSTALSGAASFVYEIVWIRMLSMAVGSTLHAFELMLTSFIAGIAFGGLWVRKQADRSADPLRLAGWMQIGMGLAALLSLLVYGNAFDWVSWIMGALDRTASGYTLYSLGTAAIAIAIMLPAAFFAGTTLPLFTVTLLRSGHGERAIGQVYAWNTVGSIAGVFVAMHWLIPVLGLKLALITAAFVDMGIGLFLLRREAQNRPQLMRTAFAALGVLLATSLSMTVVQFDPLKMASGVFRTGSTILSDDAQLIFYRDGKTASVSVTQYADARRLIATNGKTDAAINIHGKPASDEPTMALLAALPLAMHASPEEIGVIGFGSGMSTHTLLGDSRVKRVDTIEIEPAMIEGARAFGSKVERAYTDPRSNIVIDDAKAYFSGQQARYDIIVSEPSNPWISGVGTVFSKEFYEFIPRHLKPGGLFVQWVQLYEIDEMLLASIMNALTPAFSDYQAYISNTADLIIIATPQGRLPEIKPQRILQGPVGEDMKKLGIASAGQLQLRRIADAQILRAHGALFGTPANSYYRPLLSLKAPVTRYMNKIAFTLINLTYQSNLSSAMLLNAQNIRQSLPDDIETSTIDHFSGETDTRQARIYADFLRTGSLPGQLAQLPQALTSAFLLKQAVQQVCMQPDSTTAQALLASNLRQAAEQTLMALPPSRLQGVFIKPAWLPCKPTHVSEDFGQVLALTDALAQRDWAKASELAERWLRNPQAQAVWKEQFDDVALLAVMLDFARNGKWTEMAEAEKRLGANVAGTQASAQIRVLLLAMANIESARVKSSTPS